MIYFLQQNKNGPVKIGLTKNLKRRLAELQTANPERLRLLGSVAGNSYIERQIHKHLRFHHIGGEWFQLSDFVAEFIFSIPGYKPALLDRPKRKGSKAIPSEIGKINESERKIIVETLSDCEDNKSLTAKKLKMSRSTLYAKIEKYGLY